MIKAVFLLSLCGQKMLTATELVLVVKMIKNMLGWQNGSCNVTSGVQCLPLLSQMHLAVLIFLVFQLLLCSVDDTGNLSVSNKQEKILVSEVHGHYSYC